MIGALPVTLLDGECWDTFLDSVQQDWLSAGELCKTLQSKRAIERAEFASYNRSLAAKMFSGEDANAASQEWVEDQITRVAKLFKAPEGECHWLLHRVDSSLPSLTCLAGTRPCMAHNPNTISAIDPGNFCICKGEPANILIPHNPAR